MLFVAWLRESVPSGMFLAALAAVFGVAAVLLWALKRAERDAFNRDWRDYDR